MCNLVDSLLRNDRNQARWATAYVGLGSNLGDRAEMLRRAVSALSDHAEIRVDFASGISSLYESSPVGGPDGQGYYFNSVIRIETTLNPAELLGATQAIERELGRRVRARWDEREIDIDLLCYDSLIVGSESLKLPHPELGGRLFVLEPFSEIAGNMRVPGTAQTVERLTSGARSVQENQEVVRVADHRWVSQD